MARAWARRVAVEPDTRPVQILGHDRRPEAAKRKAAGLVGVPYERPLNPTGYDPNLDAKRHLRPESPVVTGQIQSATIVRQMAFEELQKDGHQQDERVRDDDGALGRRAFSVG